MLFSSPGSSLHVELADLPGVHLLVPRLDAQDGGEAVAPVFINPGLGNDQLHV